ncbi:uncharacterized protein LOC119629247 [Bombyx mori]|uniref:Reverse transcriptase n=1 Tax=Bombyx mori TaxID=7091 RepID=A0A8R2M1E1_BOMMO|nr:uncharacterized protein LOC119629247 [Bombyx mori]
MVALLDLMERISKEMGLFINRSKTKVMVVDRSGKLELTGALDLDIVDNFNYVGSNISNNGSCEKKVRRRISMAKSAMTQLGKIWRDHNIPVKTKQIRNLVFSVVLEKDAPYSVDSVSD